MPTAFRVLFVSTLFVFLAFFVSTLSPVHAQNPDESAESSNPSLGASCRNNQMVLSYNWDFGTGNNCEAHLIGGTESVVINQSCRTGGSVTDRTAEDVTDNSKVMTLVNGGIYQLVLKDAAGTNHPSNTATISCTNTEDSTGDADRGIGTGGTTTPATTRSSTTGEPITRENWGHAQQNALMIEDMINVTAPCIITGSSWVKEGEGEENKTCPSYADGSLKVYNRVPNGGALGSVGNMIAGLYTPPTSTGEYLASVGSNLGIVDTAYAQSVAGSGEGVIRPVLRIWQISRNLSYLVFTLVFLAIGFMIMFRKQLSQQAVVSIQSALPGLIIALILVTFSYFITAFLVDLSFVGMQLAAYLFSEQVMGPNIIHNGAVVARDGNVLNLFGGFIINGNHLDQIVVPIKDVIVRTIPGGTAVFDNPLLLLAGGTGAIILALPYVIGGLVMIILLIAALIQMFRLFVALVKAYITILVYTILAPFIILMSAFPGQGGKVSTWWKTILANSLIFPAVFAAFLFAGTFLANTKPEDFKNTLPLFGGFPVDLLKIVIGYGIILATPAVPDMVKKALGVKEDDSLGKLAMSGFQAGAAPVSMYAKKGYGKAIEPWKANVEAYKQYKDAKNMYDRTGVIPSGWDKKKLSALQAPGRLKQYGWLQRNVQKVLTGGGK